MRKISINRPNEKLRGVQRRLKALDLWADSMIHEIPYHKDQKYWNYKIPVLDRLVCPPTTNNEIQSRALSSLLKAASHLANSSLSNELPYYRVAVLLVLPNMFASEVTAFFDKTYYESFFYENSLLPNNEQPSEIFEIDLPPGIEQRGTLVEWDDEYEDGEIVKCSEKWWTIGPRP